MIGIEWSDFAERTRNDAHWPLMERAATLAGKPGRALDLGAGGGRDTRYLLAHGWQVTAVDSEPAAIAILSQIDDPKLTIVQGTIQDFTFERKAYDLISAQFSLPFVPREEFDRVFASIKEALKPGGFFAGHFFGLNDEWNRPGSNITFHSRGKVAELLSGMKVIELKEEDGIGAIATGGTKHWHVYRVIAQRPGAGD